ncbi:MAG TPA: 16S rRNA (adenine(1518)-N(6)/adenine(1519)-N(6))-dimethyltransferase RsmA [Spirochaetota bacterium]|nr:16S rRNA (adenine(1518)-N(6)/adenine(1519)-N(6))-dimethyltransferase RsmA [Spirochaetota bacterium]HPI88181.1 16S rRNA (adenine(1518)-N(6)/adenine(1519)-N(6))-dimethyltransferase RsmA [Spirochaetota bacterium]HPR47956.1 16S rRNA (adenine(1518)-N(6)/adenine(1519)-N(6))-dimethyltransferase RsmA [Spirochaetota bacterium]
MNITEVKRISSLYGLHPNKKLGQNFLIDEGIRRKITQAVNPCADDRILEIGPGLGSLTELLAVDAGRVTAVEIDAGLYRYLVSRFGDSGKVNLIHGDFLKTPLTDEFNKVVSNLPYYCASEILFRILSDLAGAGDVFVMLQQEMAERIIAAPGTKSYGALTISLNYYCFTKKLFRVPSGCFHPRPDVSSLFIKLERKKELPLSRERLDLFHEVVRSAFWGRRKTLLTSLSQSPHLTYARDVISGVLSFLGMSTSVRGEDLAPEDYVAITEALYAQAGDDARS